MDAGHDLSMHVTEQDGIIALALEGDLDLASGPGFRERLLDLFASGVRHVVIDLGNLAYIDSIGLGILVASLKRYREAAGDIALRRPQGQVSRVLEVTGVSQLFDVEPD